ncbi:hypothetical protein AB1Y20_013662 [Prymnesium parvum]|uniref:Acylphosphatase n=1 Tax=Prymnesium parvum TaxID=97485 RepID=A0AB34IJL9_PRYPA
MAALLALLPLFPPLPPLTPRARPALMGGFESSQFRPLDAARVSLRVSGSAALIASLPPTLRSHLTGGITGVMYEVNARRLELIAEGERPLLETLVRFAEDAVEGEEGAECRMSWQLPGGGYDETFPLVRLAEDMRAEVELRGDPATMAYYARHLNVEAVFNRGLKVSERGLNHDRLTVSLSGDADRLKSFVRWCYNGPRLARAEKVTVTWKK